MQIHVVQPGEMFETIAAQYGVSPQFLQNYNQIPNPQQLVVGQSLLIVNPQTTYVVESNDTLEGIAAKTGFRMVELLQRNPQLINRPVLYAGETLVLSFDGQESVPLEVNGYAYPYVSPAVLRTSLPYLTYLTIFGYGFDLEGNLTVIDDEPLIALAQEYETAPMMLLSSVSQEGVFNSYLASRLMQDAVLQETVLVNVLSVMEEKGYAGLDIDFEYIPPEDREGYIAFVERAAELLNPLGYIVHVDLAPKTSASQAGLLYESHDYAALGAIANQVLVMTYEWGYTYGPPMAVAPLNQVRRVLEYAVTEISPQKIQMGIPNYAYDWILPYERGRAATSIGNMQAIETAVRYGTEILYDTTAETPYFYYTGEEGSAHVVWFEDARSIDAKLELLKELQLGGAGYWNVMRPFTQNWSLLIQKFSVVKRTGSAA